MIKTGRLGKMKKSIPWFYIAIGVLSVTTLFFAGTTFFYYERYAQPMPAVGAALGVDRLLTDVAKIIALPTGEKPTIATVADPEKLKAQPFFAKAQIGDKVLIYPQAHQAILYRPTENKIVEIGPFSADVTSTNP